MTPNRPGRPPGCIDEVIAGKAFGMDEFVAVRAFLKGIDPLTSCRQYLLAEETPKSTLSAFRRIEELISRIAVMVMSRKFGEASAIDERNRLAAGHLNAAAKACKDKLQAYQRAKKKASKEVQEQLIKEAQKLGLEPLPPHKQRPPLPSYLVDLKEFANHHDRVVRPDYDLDPIELRAALEDFKAEYWRKLGYYYRPDHSNSVHEYSEGVDKNRYTTEMREREFTRIDYKLALAAEKAMESATWTTLRKPNVADTLGSWFKGTALDRLAASDIFTMYSLCDVIKRRGTHWWRTVPGLGPVRARRIENWLKEVKVEGFEITDKLFESVQRRRLIESVVDELERPPLPELVECELEPLSPYVEQPELSGSDGIFRRPGANMLKAQTDIEAILVTLRKYADKPKTLSVYAREICRFCLWAYTEKRIPISSVGVDEARQYRKFLDAIPPDWISSTREAVPRGSSEWRPFRGQLEDASKRKALTSINVVMRQLMESGYLTGNPFSGVIKHAELPKPKIDASRSFDLVQWALICEQLDFEENKTNNELDGKRKFNRYSSANARRTKALIHTLQSTGLRRDELENARLGNITKITIDGEASYLLTVAGKRSKYREVVIHRNILDLITAHLADRPTLFNDDLTSKDGRLKVPLISVLHEPVANHQIIDNIHIPRLEDAHSKVQLTQRDLANSCGALSANGMRDVIKAFFRRCKDAAVSKGIDTEAFEKASLHWMRHTFGHSMVDAGVDVRVVQKIMGHVNINTTAIYSKADVTQMVRGAKQGAQAINSATAFRLGTISPDNANPLLTDN